MIRLAAEKVTGHSLRPLDLSRSVMLWKSDLCLQEAHEIIVLILWLLSSITKQV